MLISTDGRLSTHCGQMLGSKADGPAIAKTGRRNF
jgi:hypothetical protein